MTRRIPIVLGDNGLLQQLQSSDDINDADLWNLLAEILVEQRAANFMLAQLSGLDLSGIRQIAMEN